MTDKTFLKSNIEAIKTVSKNLEDLHHLIFPLSYRGIDKQYTMKAQKDIRSCHKNLTILSKVIIKGLNRKSKENAEKTSA